MSTAPSSSIRGLLGSLDATRRADRAGGDRLGPRRRTIRWLAADSPQRVVADGLTRWLRETPGLTAADLDRLADLIDPSTTNRSTDHAA